MHNISFGKLIESFKFITEDYNARRRRKKEESAAVMTARTRTQL